MWGASHVLAGLEGMARIQADISGAWLFGFFGSAILALIFTGVDARVVARLRYGRFQRHYLPTFRNFFERSTPELLKRFPPS